MGMQGADGRSTKRKNGKRSSVAGLTARDSGGGKKVIEEAWTPRIRSGERHPYNWVPGETFTSICITVSSPVREIGNERPRE